MIVPAARLTIIPVEESTMNIPSFSRRHMLKTAACGFGYLAQHADDLCVLNGMYTDNPSHPQATIQLHTGSVQFVRPSMGAWVLYGLGTQNQNLPGFITINPPNAVGGAQNYGAAFLPAAFQ